MSDIPLARAKLYDALVCTSLADCKAAIGAALNLMIRDTPAYRAPNSRPAMTRSEVKRAKLLRRQGMSVDTIAKRMGHNIGRISEAINGKRRGI